jgi:hypothetical protein
MYIEIVMKKGDSPSYFPAEAILSQVELEIGGTRVDLHYNDWYRAYSELFRTSEEKLAYKRMTDFVDGESAGTLKRFYLPLCFYFESLKSKASYPRNLGSCVGQSSWTPSLDTGQNSQSLVACAA